MIRIGVIGSNGRMGQRIEALALADNLVEITAKIDRDTEDTIKSTIDKTDVFIDFSSPTATMKNLDLITKNKKALVIGTTGFSEEEIENLKLASQKTAILLAPNMSVGVNVFFKIVEQAAKYLPDYNMELTEMPVFLSRRTEMRSWGSKSDASHN